jgi:transposase InsO family protein
MLGPATGAYFYLFVILDIYSLYVVGWTVQHQKTAPLAERLIAETLAKQNIARHQLTIHADRGSAMRSKPVAFLLSDSAVTKTHSRMGVSPFGDTYFLPSRTGQHRFCGESLASRVMASAVCRARRDPPDGGSCRLGCWGAKRRGSCGDRAHRRLGPGRECAAGDGDGGAGDRRFGRRR